MSNPRLVIDASPRDDVYRITYYFPDEDELGGSLGEDQYTDAQLAKAKPEDWEHIAANLAAGKTPGVRRHNGSYVWESKSAATAALRAVKAVLKAGGKWPEWATKAVSEGWKPPKGWKP